jgi:CTP:molybdopterin cytidylyltransferase MocA
MKGKAGVKGNLGIVIPAAGASSRMRGADKLLQRVGGEALLARQVRIARGAGLRVLVTVPPEAAARRAVVAPFVGGAVEIATVAEASEGIAASLRAGAQWAQAQGACGLMIVLADMPELEARDLVRMRAAFEAAPERVVRAASEQGRPGHPVIFPARLFKALGQLRGDEGARHLLAGEEVVEIRLPGQRAVIDLDTPEAWAAWRRGV